MTEVALVSMPFNSVLAPSLGLSLIQAQLRRRGFSSTIHYFSIRFAELLGMSLYASIADGEEPSLEEMAGEWIFSCALFEATPEQERRYVRDILVRRLAWSEAKPRTPSSVVRKIVQARSRVDRYLDWCVDRLLAREPQVVGFSSSFQQHVASLALARRIKERRPNVAIIFGGPNCAGAMGAETVRQFRFVDAAVSGEGDFIGSEAIARLLAGRPLEGLPGVRTFREVQGHTGPWSDAPLVEDLDSLPVPDYSDYFEQFRASRFHRAWIPTILFETSRGCWWGHRSHCTFCGLNAAGMRFRSKSADVALAQLVDLKKKHPRSDVLSVDTILDLKYFDTFLPELEKRRLKTGLLYETKSNLRKEQVRKLRDAGVLRIQPGIESFSDSVLRIMRKGVTALQNIQLLKWCREFGIEVFWNLIWGFPGEDANEYGRIADLVPLLTHLQPPLSVGELRLERFSPSFEQPSQFGFTDVRPLESYRYIYPLSEDALRNLACFFSFRRDDGSSPDDYTKRLWRRLESWHSVSTSAALFSVEVGGSLLICDVRPCAKRVLTVLSGIDEAIYVAADSIVSARALSQSLSETPERVEQRLEWMVGRKLMIRDGTRYLALAVPIGDYQPGPKQRSRFRRAIRNIGARVDGGTRVRLSEPVSMLNQASARRRRRSREGIDRSLFVVESERSIKIMDCR